MAVHATQDSNDKQQLNPVLKKVERNTTGEMPEVASTDSGYFSERNCKLLESRSIDGYIATEKQKHGERYHPNRVDGFLKMQPLKNAWAESWERNEVVVFIPNAST